ncbi:MAG: ABC transporter substrate-binding protein [Oligoflexales bacterium]
MSLRPLLILTALLSFSNIAKAAKPAPQRIASFCLGCDEILWELLRTDRNRIVGLSHLADDKVYSAIAEEVPAKLASLGDNMEYLAQLKPDLVILASYNRPEIALTVKKLGVTAVTLQRFNTFNDIVDNIRTLGRATGKTREANDLVESMNAQLKTLAAEYAKASVKPTVLNFSADGTIWGAGSLFDEIVSKAGGSNLALTLGIKGWPVVNVERIATLNPDFIVVATADNPLDFNLKTMAGWKIMPAVKRNKIIEIRPAWLHSVSHHIVKAVHALHQGLYAR